MVLLRNSLLRKRAPEQMSWLAAQRAMLCTTKKYWKVSPLELHPNAVSQPIKINGKSFVDVTLRVDVLFDILILPQVTEKSQELKKQVLHCTCLALWIDRTMRRNLSVWYSSQKFWCTFSIFCCWQDSSPRSSLSASCFIRWFEIIENGSCLARKWRIRVGIEPNATIGQLVGCGTTNISDTKKAHVQLVASEFDAHTHAWDQKKLKN